MPKMLHLLRVLLVGLVLMSAPQHLLAQDIFGLGGASEEPAPAEGADAAPDAEAAPLETLIEVLRDDAARQTLIEELESQVTADPAEGTPAETPEQSISFGGRIADYTQQLTNEAAASVEQVWTQMGQLPGLFGTLGSADYGRIGTVLLDLGALVVATYAAFFLTRFLVERSRRLLPRRGSGMLGRTIAMVLLLVTNLVIVVVAWAVANVVALTLIGRGGFLAFEHSLFLNAFLVVELTQALVRAVLAPRRAELRPVTLSDEMAIMLTRWSRLVVSVLVFGQLLLVPIFNRYVSVQAGQALTVIDYFIVLAMVLNLVLRVREPVARWLSRLGGKEPDQPGTGWARYWHLPVIAYVLVLFGVILIWPEAVLLEMLGATIKVIIAIVIGLVAAHLLSRLILSGVRLPGNLSSRIPLLEQRLNSFVPRALTLLRILVVVAVAAVTLDSIGVFSVSSWLASEFGAQVATSAITVAIILTVSFVLWLGVNSWVDYRLEPASGLIVKSRERTLLSLLRNAVSVSIVVFATMFTLSEVGINIAPLLASAGVIGLAVGFGAQKLVQDIITGIFIQLEGAIDVGDVVDIGGISGSVERLTIRSAGLRDVNGVYHIVPFSSVTIVSNFMRGFAFALCDMGVAYRENLDDVKQAMVDAFEALKQNKDVAADIVDPKLEWMGIDKFLDSAVIVRARIKTLPGRQWAVNRAYNAEVKKVFDERGIEIPFPHQTVYFGEDKRGRAAPLHLVSERPPRRSRNQEADGTPEAGQDQEATPRNPDASVRTSGGPEVPDDDESPEQSGR
jgi:small conductance mechanosensitive channel